jgi:hypothetical protein
MRPLDFSSSVRATSALIFFDHQWDEHLTPVLAINFFPLTREEKGAGEKGEEDAKIFFGFHFF